MKKAIPTLFTLVIFSLMSACTSLQTVSISSIPKNRSSVVEANVSKTVFLGFNFDNDYLDEIPLKLARKCPKGMIRGVLTKHEVVSYIIVNTHNISAKGYCTRK